MDFFYLILILAIAVGLAGLALGFRRNNRVGAANMRRADGQVQLDATALEALDKRAAGALVACDDLVRGAENELEFARAQFGVLQTDAFAQVIEKAKADLAPAFELRKLLDDAHPETPAQRQDMCQQIIEICTRMRTEITEQYQQFQKLRSEQSNLDQSIALMRQRLGEMQARLGTARQVLAQLAIDSPQASLESIKQNPDLAASLMEAAGKTLDQAETSLAGGDKAQAATQVNLAGRSVEQALQLITQVETAPEQLKSILDSLSQALTSIGADLQDAQNLAPDDAVVQAAAKIARQAVEQGSAARAGQGDPLAALNALTSAESGLDQSLEPFRAQAESRAKQVGQLQGRLQLLDGQIAQAEGFINTRRGAVGSSARALLGQASAQAAQVRQILASTAPLGPAVELLGAAETNVAKAFDLARQEAASFQYQMPPMRRPRGGMDLDLGALVLGGVLAGSLGGSIGGALGEALGDVGDLDFDLGDLF